jgi:hypothetical protein
MYRSSLLSLNQDGNTRFMSKQRLTPLRIVLVHSPLVGTLWWSKLAPLLESWGHEVLVSDLTMSFEDGSPYCD